LPGIIGLVPPPALDKSLKRAIYEVVNINNVYEIDVFVKRLLRMPLVIIAEKGTVPRVKHTLLEAEKT
jgi:hypothetical protein